MCCDATDELLALLVLRAPRRVRAIRRTVRSTINLLLRLRVSPRACFRRYTPNTRAGGLELCRHAHHFSTASSNSLGLRRGSPHQKYAFFGTVSVRLSSRG